MPKPRRSSNDADLLQIVNFSPTESTEVNIDAQEMHDQSNRESLIKRWTY